MKKYKTAFIWISASIITLIVIFYQRMTGPTYPVNYKTMIGETLIKARLPRSADCGADQPVKIKIPDTSVHGVFTYKRYPSYEEWKCVPMQRSDDQLIAMIPEQPFAGKVSYKITLVKDGKEFPLNLGKEVIIRFKNPVPLTVLILHIIFIFGAILLSTVTGLVALTRGKNLLTYTWLTVIFTFIGGMILGPVMQKYAFNAFWTGWPFGHDLTDNKTLVGLIFWIVALIIQYRRPGKRLWSVAASIIFLVVFLIPHSVLGSEIDYTRQTPPAQQK